MDYRVDYPTNLFEEPVGSKMCILCDQVRPLTMFKVCRARPDGRGLVCLECKPRGKKSSDSLTEEEKEARRKQNREYQRKYMLQRRELAMANGLCVVCEEKALPSKTVCQKHFDQREEYDSKRDKNRANRMACVRRQQKREEGICLCCKKPALDGFMRCQDHIEKARKGVKYYRDKKVASGICAVCKEPLMPGSRLCHKHAARRNKRCKQRAEELKSQGLCTACGKLPLEEGRRACAPCLEKRAEENRKEVAFRRANKLCLRCGMTPMASCSRCKKCYLKCMAKDHLNNWHAWDQLEELFDAQSGMCAYSGLPLILGVNSSIDHVVSVMKGGAFTIENVCWCHRDVNQMKGRLGKDRFLELASLIHNHTRSRS